MEAFYRYFLKLYMSNKTSTSPNSESNIQSSLASLVEQFSNIRDDDELVSFHETVASMLQSFQDAGYSYAAFQAFIQALSEKEDTIKFWLQFINT